MVLDSSEFNRIVDKYADVVFRSALSFCSRGYYAEHFCEAVEKRRWF